MISLFLVLLCWAQAPVATNPPPTLVNERANASITNGVLELRGGHWWVRTSRPLLDYDVQFEFRALTPDAEPGLMLRTWVGTGRWPSRGYRLTLPTAPGIDPASLLVARQQTLRVVQSASLGLRPAGEWQTMKVTAQGESVRIALNGSFVAEFAVEETGGYVMFDNRKGRIELRNVTFTELYQPFAPEVTRSGEWEKASGQRLQVVHETKPKYTPAAMKAAARGIVLMQAVVLPDGSVGRVRITQSLHQDLDAAAMVALKQWKFRPPILNGKPIAVVTEIEMTFTTR